MENSVVPENMLSEAGDPLLLRNIFVATMNRYIDNISDINYRYLQEQVADMTAENSVEEKILPFAPSVEAVYNKYIKNPDVLRKMDSVTAEVEKAYKRFEEGFYVFSEGAGGLMYSPRVSKSLNLEPKVLYLHEMKDVIQYLSPESAQAYMVNSVLILDWDRKINPDGKTMSKGLPWLWLNYFPDEHFAQK